MVRMLASAWRRRGAAAAVIVALAIVSVEAVPAIAEDATPPAESAPAATPSAAPVAAPVDPPAEQPIVAPRAPTIASTSARRVDRLLQRRWHDGRIGRAFGMLVIDAQTGEVISAHNPDRPMRAASNMKLVTAVNALASMGPDKRFSTKVFAGSTARDVILQGAGDPLLTTSGLQRLADRTARQLKRGQRAVVHVDGDLFAPRRKGPGWLNYSVASVQALARLHDNSKSPSRNAASVFTARLRSHGIRATLGANRDAIGGARLLASAPGHTVAESLAYMLAYSESNIAEVLFRQTAIATGHKPTWKGGARAAKVTLESLGVSTHDVQLLDGSGLSRLDRLTPRFLTSMLRVAKVEQPERFAAMFRTSAMPVAGVSGTLTPAYGRYSTYPSRCASGRVQAKTGTLFDTIALSGVATTKSDGMRIFSFIVNERPRAHTPLSTRRAIDGLAATVEGCWD